MGSSTLICITVLFLSVFSCDSSGEESKANKDTKSDSTLHVMQSSQDTMSPQKDTIPDMPPPPDPAPAPGTVRLYGKVLNVKYSSNADTVSFDFKVLKILAIGAAAPPVAPADTLHLKTNIFTDSIKKENKIIALLKERKVMQLGQQDKNTEWNLISIENKNKSKRD